MEFEDQDFTGIHVWYEGKAWMVEGHDHVAQIVTLFHPDIGKINVKEEDIKPRT